MPSKPTFMILKVRHPKIYCIARDIHVGVVVQLCCEYLSVFFNLPSESGSLVKKAVSKKTGDVGLAQKKLVLRKPKTIKSKCVQDV